ncbi:OLC1v1023845C1 [Oldenlandia corymbosa var. corymbosa]|uniref:OLC1v1023845C1 n=1 Tax=Oldenlandia corymbosa var. corymbosa TaxID=529605 RepID=A0AAV1C3Y0_OLDCO|nr:OLC1v1023845C1 [Oldenlandia corymbosa var. corymbosa]
MVAIYDVANDIVKRCLEFRGLDKDSQEYKDLVDVKLEKIHISVIPLSVDQKKLLDDIIAMVDLPNNSDVKDHIDCLEEANNINEALEHFHVELLKEWELAMAELNPFIVVCNIYGKCIYEIKELIKSRNFSYPKSADGDGQIQAINHNSHTKMISIQIY